MWSANGMRRLSVITPPHAPEAGPKPKQDNVFPGLVGVKVEHLAVRPSRHS